LERPEDVRKAAEEGLAAAGDDPFLYYMAGLARIQTNDFSGAIASLTRAKDLGTEASDINLWLGEAHRELGHVDEAVAAYKAQANATPHDVRPTVAAGMLLAESNRCQEALPLLFTAIQRGTRSQNVRDTYRKCGGM
jgi:thioredoxin-like negative regulator of GroEL